MNKILRWMFAIAIAVVAGAILIRAVAQVGKEQPGEDKEKSEETVKTTSRVTTQNGETVLTLDSQSESRLGLTVIPLQPISTREQVTAPAVVLPVQDLVDLRNAYVAAQTKLEKAQINAGVSRKEYERLKALHQDNQNASQKTLESAEGASLADQADVRAATQELALQVATVRQAWGEEVEKWVVNRSPEFERVLDQREVMVAVTLPSGGISQAPPSVSLEVPDGTFVQASKVSPIPRLDPRIQGITFLYVTPAHLGLAPSVNLVAHLPVGRKMQGVLVPAAAVVWWQGKAWVYQQTADDRFTRRDVPTDTPVSNGFFIAKGLAAGDKIVVTGAQMLLSEEYRSQGESASESDND